MYQQSGNFSLTEMRNYEYTLICYQELQNSMTQPAFYCYDITDQKQLGEGRLNLA